MELSFQVGARAQKKVEHGYLEKPWIRNKEGIGFVNYAGMAQKMYRVKPCLQLVRCHALLSAAFQRVRMHSGRFMIRYELERWVKEVLDTIPLHQR